MSGWRPAPTSWQPPSLRPGWRFPAAASWVSTPAGRCSAPMCRHAVPLPRAGLGWCRLHVPDEVAVERAIQGDRRVPLTVSERAEAVHRLALAGYSDSAIADRLGVCDRTVLRIRAAHRIPSIRATAGRTR